MSSLTLPDAMRRPRAEGYTVREDGPHLLVDGVADAAQVTRALAAHDHWLTELVPVHAGLEAVFLELVGKDEAAGTRHDRRGDHAVATQGVVA